MEAAIDFTKSITIILLVLIVSAHTIGELLDTRGWLPLWLERPLHERKRKVILETLAQAGITPTSSKNLVRETIRELGIEDRVPWVRSVNHVLNIRTDHGLPEAHPDLQKSLREIVGSYIEKGNFVIGSTSQREVKYFVNLRHAFCAPPTHLELDKRLAEIMLAHIRECFRSLGLSADAVVARKNGLNALAYLVARAMGKPLLLYTEDASIWSRRDSGADSDNGVHTNRPRHLDYLLPAKTTAIIVDDSCVGGNSFKDLADDLRRHDIQIAHAFVLFSRQEVDAVRALRGQGIELHPLDTYSDSDLAGLLATPIKVSP